MQTNQAYAYAAGNPVSMTDPSGMWSIYSHWHWIWGWLGLKVEFDKMGTQDLLDFWWIVIATVAKWYWLAIQATAIWAVADFAFRRGWCLEWVMPFYYPAYSLWSYYKGGYCR